MDRAYSRHRQPWGRNAAPEPAGNQDTMCLQEDTSIESPLRIRRVPVLSSKEDFYSHIIWLLSSIDLLAAQSLLRPSFSFLSMTTHSLYFPPSGLPLLSLFFGLLLLHLAFKSPGFSGPGISLCFPVPHLLSDHTHVHGLNTSGC